MSNEEEYQLSEEEIILCYEMMALIANADEDLSTSEIDHFKRQMDSMGLDKVLMKKAVAALMDPPELDDLCERLVGSHARFTVFMEAIAMADADGDICSAESELLARMASKIDISPEQIEAMTSFYFAAKAATEGGHKATKTQKAALSEAAAHLGAVGVPIGAVAISGSVFGLSAAGVTSGLAFLGMGFGMVPGLGVAVGLGIATYLGVKYLFSE